MDEDVRKCRRNGWKVGTRLIGDEGYGPSVIELTAIGESLILAKLISHSGDTDECGREAVWTLGCRNWRRVRTNADGDRN